ncbi:MAG: hydrogenase maturation nickel metallochaperone HypA [Chloroflexi bacterium]|nr:MAG: hydrogenase maturation nickel metallochaperone HypA [Chloroflexota bacterium]RPI96158.1 MAG: hydrogenase maturation nickel metallochaperone HypA [Chloroflexota bacterium]
MHEFSLTQNLLDIALKNADSKRIVHVNLLIGPFSDEREESIQFYWRDLAKGTLGEGARLHFKHARAEMKCLACGGTFNLDEDASLCVYCQSDRLQMLSGDEVRLESMEVE